MLVSDCCRSIPYNDNIRHRDNIMGRSYIGVCAECMESVSFISDKDDGTIYYNDPADEHQPKVDKDVHKHSLGVGFAHKDNESRFKKNSKIIHKYLSDKE